MVGTRTPGTPPGGRSPAAVVAAAGGAAVAVPVIASTTAAAHTTATPALRRRIPADRIRRVDRSGGTWWMFTGTSPHSASQRDVVVVGAALGLMATPRPVRRGSGRDAGVGPLCGG